MRVFVLMVFAVFAWMHFSGEVQKGEAKRTQWDEKKYYDSLKPTEWSLEKALEADNMSFCPSETKAQFACYLKLAERDCQRHPNDKWKCEGYLPQLRAKIASGALR